MSQDAAAKVVDGRAWAEFCDLLRKAGDVIQREDLATTPFDRAEGLRYLSRLLAAGFASFVEATCPAHPVFRPLPDMVKMGLDNPDNYYVSASIDPRHDYRIRGRRGTIHYLSFAAQNQNFAARDRITGGAGHLNDSELALEPDGSFEIVASAREQAGATGGERGSSNWLRLAPDTKQILVRQTFLDRARERPVEIAIECLGAPEPAPVLDPARVPGQLLGSAMYAIGCAQWFADWVIGFRDRAPVNAFHLPGEEDHRRLGGDPNIRLWLGTWRLGRDEALIVEAMPPKCHYWNFQLGNVWAESLDHRFQRVHINGSQAEYRGDGSFELVVAHCDPGHPNWISTAGHEHGTMGLRWVLADSHPEPRTRVVRVADLRRRASASTPAAPAS
ncbi:MAG TPA: DUF1214 domain-containing protein [Myxococcota bacterium]|nr:DUF1214 domain-containing protein [Myxococcota bacterium]